MSERLTEKNTKSGIYYPLETEPTYDECKMVCIQKLGELEDIEDELGCPLETLFKALTQGVYAKYTVAWEPEVKKEIGKFSVCLVRNLFGLKGWFIMAGRKEIDFWGLNEHGKTWALTKEELEEGGR